MMRRWLSGPERKRTPSTRQVRPGVERLEGREVPAALISANVSGTDSASGTSNLAPGGVPGSHSLSAAGRFVVFVSSASATNLLGTAFSQGTGAQNVFLRDTVAGTTTLVSRSRTVNTAGNGSSDQAIISADGKFVFFRSAATDLDTTYTDAGANPDLFQFEVATGKIGLVSHTAAAATVAADAPGAKLDSVSADGSRLVFESTATNLVANQVDTAGTPDVFLYDRGVTTGGNLRLVSYDKNGVATAAGNTANTTSGSAVISADGKFVAFVSNLSAAGVNTSFTASTGKQVYLLDVNSATPGIAISLVSHVVGGNTMATTGDSSLPSISGDGRRVAFLSAGTNLVANQSDLNNGTDVFVFDRGNAGTVSMVSHNTLLATASANLPSDYAVISGDGSTVAFRSQATDLVTTVGDFNNAPDVFVNNLAQNVNVLVSATAAGTRTGNGASGASLDVSDNGQTVSFESQASDLVSAVTDANGAADVFTRSVPMGTTTVNSVTPDGTRTGDAASTDVQLSGTGSAVIWQSSAKTLAPLDTNGDRDVFLGTAPLTPTSPPPPSPFAGIPPGQLVPPGSVIVAFGVPGFAGRRFSVRVTLRNTTNFFTGPLNVYLLGMRRFTLRGAAGFATPDIPFVRVAGVNANGTMDVVLDLGVRASRLGPGGRLNFIRGLPPAAPSLAAVVTTATTP
jgi:hypothetical protein